MIVLLYTHHTHRRFMALWILSDIVLL